VGKGKNSKEEKKTVDNRKRKGSLAGFELAQQTENQI
jgi:hypothetical protein